MRRAWLTLLLLATVLCAALAPAGLVLAAGNNKGITIAPPFQEITILPNQTSVAQSFAVTNNNDAAATFGLSTIDMGTLDDSGGVVFSGLNADYQQKYGLAKWVQLENPTITVAPHTTQNVNFSIINDPALGPGGHYGAIVIDPEQPNGSGKNEVSLNPQTASLLFVRKVGGEVFGLDFVSAKGSTSWWQLPKQLTIKLKNTGNVHVVPRGYALLEDSHGNQIGKGIINPESTLILPEHTRDYTVSWEALKSITWPGKYTIDVFYRYDGTDKYQHAVYTITFINLPFVGFAGLIVLAVLWLIWRAFPGPRSKLTSRLPRPKRRKKDRKPTPVSRQKIMSVRSLDQKRSTLAKPKKPAKKLPPKPKK